MFGGETFGGAAFAEARVPPVTSVFYSYWAWNLYGSQIAMFKNVAGQTITLLAIDSATNLPKTGDAANITAYVKIGTGLVTVLGDTSAAEDSSTNAKGLYTFDLTQAETNGDTLQFSGKSSTSGVTIVPQIISTIPASWTIPRVTLCDTTTTNTDMRGTDGAVTSLSGLATGTDVSNLQTHGDSSWATATGFAVAGDAMALTPGERTTLTASIWNALASGIATAGSIGKRIIDYLTGDVFADTTNIKTRLPAALTSDGMIKADTLYINGTGQSNGDLNLKIDAVPTTTELDTALGNLQTHGDSTWATATGFSTLDGNQVAAAVLDATASSHNTAGSIGEKINSATAPTAAAVADAVWDEALSGHATAGSAGAKLTAAGASGDPLDNPVPGSYAAGTAGFALGEVAAVRVLGPIGSTVTRPGEVLPGETIVAYHYAPVEAGPILVTDEDGEPIDLSSYATDLAIVIFSTNGVTETKISQINYPNVTVGGTGNNQVSFSGSSALTVTIGRFRYGLRRRTSGAKFVRAQGEFIVHPMADVT